MAKFNLENYTAADGLGFPLNFRRGNPNPLDNSSVWANLEAAKNYAATDPVAYVGQILTVVDKENNVATVYAIQDEAGTLKKVGSSPVGDESTITVAEDGTVSLYGVAGLELTRSDEDGQVTKITYQPLLVDGKLTWVEPSTTTVEGLSTEIEGLKTRISAVEAKIGNVTEDKTVVEMIADAQAAATYDDTVLAGRVTAIEDDYLKGADKTELEGKIDQAKADAITAIMGEAGIDEKYDTLKEIADWILSDTTASAELVTRVSKIEGDYLKGADKTALQDEIDALETLVGTLPEGVATTVVAYIQAVAARVQALEEVNAEKNVIATVDETQFAIDESRNLTLLDIAMGKVTGLTDALAGKVSAEAGKRLMTDAEGTKLEGIADGAQVNVIDSVDTAQFKVDENKKLTLLDIAIGKVTGLQEALDNKVSKVEGARLITSDEATKLEKLVLGEDGTVSISGEISASNVKELGSWITTNRDTILGLLSAANEEKLNGIEAGAQANKIEAVKVGDTLLEIAEKTVAIPVGAGLKASDEITIGEDGALGVGTIGIGKLVDDGTVLILNGGAAV